MSERTELKSKTRKIVGKKVKRLRADGWIPAVVFGADLDSLSIKLAERDLAKALQEAGATALIDLYVEGEEEPHTVLARDIQRDILTSRLQHVDFYQVRLDQMVRTSPALDFVGESPLVESGAAVLVQVLNRLEVECLPTDLIDSIEVDVTRLEKMGDSITIGDLFVPSGVTILADPDDVVASVVPPRAALEMEAEIEEELAEAEMEELVLGEAEVEEGEAVEEAQEEQF
jgi:large subunit ribosomal protein L25